MPRGPDAGDQRKTVHPSATSLALEGCFQALGQGLGEAYLSAFALWLGAGGPALGLLATLPTSALALGQGLARRLRGSRATVKSRIVGGWIVQSLGYAGLGGCAFLPPAWALPAVGAAVLLAWGAAGTAMPPWSFLVSRTVPRTRYGWFFGLRGISQEAGVLPAILGGGALLSWFAGGSQALGFACLFLLAGGLRAGGVALVLTAPEPEPETAAAAPPAARGQRLPVPFRRLALYLWTLHFGTHVATPFFLPFMLQDLGFRYGLAGLLLAVPAATKVLTLRFWSRAADRIGPGPILRRASWWVALVPAVWLLSPSPWAILAAQVYSGLVWGAFELVQASAILQTSRGREQLIGRFHLVDGGMILAGSLVGGVVAGAMGAPGRPAFAAALILSALLRAVPAATLAWRVRRIGRPAWSHLRLPLRLWGVRPTHGLSLRPDDDLRPAAADYDARGAASGPAPPGGGPSPPGAG